jgi:hypothetical protein
MTIPRFSAELAVYRSAKPYQGGVRAFTVRPSDVIPALRPAGKKLRARSTARSEQSEIPRSVI